MTNDIIKKVKKKIAVFGSAVNDHAEQIAPKIKALGEALAEKNIILLTGACSGIPYKTALAAYRKNKTEIWGFSPNTTLEDQIRLNPDDDNSIYSKLIYVPAGYKYVDNIEVCRKYRNVAATAECDAAILVSGRWGTMNEFTNLNDMGKVIGILTGTGGIADLIKDLYKKISKPSKAVLIFNSSPEKLVEEVLTELN